MHFPGAGRLHTCEQLVVQPPLDYFCQTWCSLDGTCKYCCSFAGFRHDWALACMGVTILAASRGDAMRDWHRLHSCSRPIRFPTPPSPLQQNSWRGRGNVRRSRLSAACLRTAVLDIAGECAQGLCASVSAPNTEADIHEARKPPPDVRPQDTTNPHDIYIYIGVGHTCAT